MGSIDTGAGNMCHEISGHIAVQHKQANYPALGAGALILAAILAMPALAAVPDPLLNPPEGPCAPLAAGADYAAGMDANGDPVVPADVGAVPVPVPGDIAVPVGGRRAGAYIEVPGARLAPLLNPPACRR
jgi:hypothetical protein